jgi:hypothetical protein
MPGRGDHLAAQNQWQKDKQLLWFSIVDCSAVVSYSDFQKGHHVVQEVEYQALAHRRPNAELFLAMDQDDWSRLNNSMPARQSHRLKGEI